MELGQSRDCGKLQPPPSGLYPTRGTHPLLVCATSYVTHQDGQNGISNASCRLQTRLSKNCQRADRTSGSHETPDLRFHNEHTPLERPTNAVTSNLFCDFKPLTCNPYSLPQLPSMSHRITRKGFVKPRRPSRTGSCGWILLR